MSVSKLREQENQYHRINSLQVFPSCLLENDDKITSQQTSEMAVHNVEVELSDTDGQQKSDCSAKNVLKTNLNNRTSSKVKSLTENLLDLTNNAVIIVDKVGQIKFINSTGEELMDCDSDEVRSIPISSLIQLVNEVSGEIIENPVSLSLSENIVIENVSCSLHVLKQNRAFPIECSAAPIYEDQNQLVGALFIFSDVSDSRKLAHQLSWQMHHDTLTGLVNRCSFEQCLERAIYSTHSLEQQHVLCYIDIDRFKVINEICGHMAGDEVLKKISTLFQRRVRKTDILARLGGDEFGLLLYQCNLEKALSVVHQLLEEIRGFRFTWGDKIFSFSASIGVAVLDDENKSHALSLVNLACATAKNRGHNRIYVCQPNDTNIITRKGETQWIPRIFEALEEDQFCLYQQTIIPIKSLASKADKFSEILIRLKDKSGQIISPIHFIRPAEKYGLMHLIDRWVIRCLFSYLGSQSINASQRCMYTVNLSGASLNDDQFYEFVEEQFDATNVSPSLICFEITETVAISNLGKANELVKNLKQLGCSFALDDFGSGMSSFAYLQKLPIDYLKIDGAFVRDLDQDSMAYEITKSINQIAHAIGIETIAEYVENENALAKLNTLGIDYAQGYHIHKPALFIDTREVD